MSASVRHFQNMPRLQNRPNWSANSSGLTSWNVCGHHHHTYLAGHLECILTVSTNSTNHSATTYVAISTTTMSIHAIVPTYPTVSTNTTVPTWPPPSISPSQPRRLQLRNQARLPGPVTTTLTEPMALIPTPIGKKTGITIRPPEDQWPHSSSVRTRISPYTKVGGHRGM